MYHGNDYGPGLICEFLVNRFGHVALRIGGMYIAKAIWLYGMWILGRYWATHYNSDIFCIDFGMIPVQRYPESAHGGFMQSIKYL